MSKYVCFGEEFKSIKAVFENWERQIRVGYPEFYRFYKSSQDLEFTVDYFIKKAKFYNPMKRKVRPKAVFSLCSVAKFKTTEQRELRRVVADKKGQ